MARPRQAKDYTGNAHDRMVQAIAAVLKTGEPTIFRWEGVSRHTLRSVLCLRGRSWSRADEIACEIVRCAFELINATRPPWLWGQREYVQDSSATRIGYTHCLNCGMRLEEERFKFCSKQCGGLYRYEYERSLEDIAADCIRATAAREAYRKAAKSLRCETCDRVFKPSKPGQHFCSRECSGSRSVAEKMNGKHHPWMNGNGKTGAGAANGAGISLEKTATHDECSALPNASIAHTTSSSHASVARRATG